MEIGKFTSDRPSGNTSEAIKAFVRVRPPISSEISHENCIQVPSGNDIHLKSEKYEVRCKYDCVFNELSTQEEVFQKISPLLDDILLGYNASIFAYGQTSAGKTHTMLGPNGGQDLNIDKSEWGVIPRAAEYLFGHLQDRSDAGGFKYIAKASFLQIYNEKLYDLLRSSSDDTELKIREIPHSNGGGTPHNGQKSARKNTKYGQHHHGSQKRDHGSHQNQPCEVFITGLSEFRIQTTDDILRVIRVGTHSRATRSTNSNLTSSRSHAILQLTFEMESTEDGGQKMIYKSKLSLIDLAGSEKMVALGNVAVLPSSEHLKELTAINQSLSSLGNVISALASKHRPHIPYRDSKLTRILQDSLGGNTRTILMSCVTPSMLHATETISTLQFTDRAKNVMIKSKANLVIDDKSLLSNAQAEISRLKLLLKQALMKIEAMTRGETSNNSGEKSGDKAKIHLDDDGETNEEMDRVIRENKQLRRENQMLIKELKDIREAEELRRRRARERDRERDRDRRGAGMVTRDDRRGGGNSYKREWNLRDDRYFVGDDRRGKKKPKERGRKDKLDLPAVNRSQTSPMNSNTPMPVSHPPPNLAPSSNNHKDESVTLPSISPGNSSSAPETYSIPPHRQYKIREALGLDTSSQQNKESKPISLQGNKTTMSSTSPVTAAIIGSPSKSSLDRLRNEYFTQAESPEKEKEGTLNDDEEDDEDFDVKKLRAKLQKAQNSTQLKEVEKSLNEATKNIVSQLEIDERSLADIRKSRRDLEKQLQELKSQQDEEGEESDGDDGEERDSPKKDNQTPTPTKLSSSVSSTSLLSPTPQFLSRQSSLSRLQTRDEFQSSASNSGPSLSNDRGDIGKKMELYIYRYNCWEVIEIVDYEASKGLHKCRHLDKTEQWIDLKKKQLREIK